jgi:hypothetical protein
MKNHPDIALKTLPVRCGMCVLCSFVGANAEKIRITQKKSGKTITVESISIKDDLLICELRGKSYEFPLSSLTDKSVERIKALLEKSPATTSSDLSYLNEAFGVTLFAKKDRSGMKIPQR